MGSSFIRRCNVRTVVLLTAALSLSMLVYGRDEEPTIGVGLMQALGSVDNVSARAATNANDAILDAAATLRLLVEALQQSEQNILDRRPSDLTAAQRKAFEAIQAGVAVLQVAADRPAEQSRERIDEIRRLTSDLSPLPGEPAVVGSSPSILAPSALNDSVFTVTGRQLSTADPRLFFGNAEAPRTRLTDQEALFTLPADSLRSDDRNPVAYSGRLLLSIRNCRWRIRCKSTLRTYTVGLVMVPTRLATVRIGFDRKKAQRIYDQVPAAQDDSASASSDVLYEKRFDYSTEDLTVMSCVHESQAPHADGYLIDTDTLSEKVADHSGETRWRILEASTSGFSVELCAQPQIDRMGKTNGSLSLAVTWKEYRMGDVITPREWREPEALNWGAQIQESLPEDTHEIEVALEYFDGSRASFTQTSKDRYVELQWNPQTHQLDLIPRLRSSLGDPE
jgi:hypothetical protein